MSRRSLHNYTYHTVGVHIVPLTKQHCLHTSLSKLLYVEARNASEFGSAVNGCSKFAQLFNEKVRMIRIELEVSRSSNPRVIEKTNFTESVVSFVPTSDDEIQNTVFRPVSFIRCQTNRFSSACHHWFGNRFFYADHSYTRDLEPM